MKKYHIDNVNYFVNHWSYCLKYILVGYVMAPKNDSVEIGGVSLIIIGSTEDAIYFLLRNGCRIM